MLENIIKAQNMHQDIDYVFQELLYLCERGVYKIEMLCVRQVTESK